MVMRQHRVVEVRGDKVRGPAHLSEGHDCLDGLRAGYRCERDAPDSNGIAHRRAPIFMATIRSGVVRESTWAADAFSKSQLSQASPRPTMRIARGIMSQPAAS